MSTERINIQKTHTDSTACLIGSVLYFGNQVLSSPTEDSVPIISLASVTFAPNVGVKLPPGMHAVAKRLQKK